MSTRTGVMSSLAAMVVLGAAVSLTPLPAAAGKGESGRDHATVLMKPELHHANPLRGVDTRGPSSSHRNVSPNVGGQPSRVVADSQIVRDANAPGTAAPVQQTAFYGMNQLRSGSLGSGFPPDITLASSSNTVLQAVNRRVQLRTLTGGILDTQNLDIFFKGTTTNTMFDPKVYFDRNSSRQRYYVVALDGQTPSFSRLHIAISRSATPTSFNTSSWCKYSFDARTPVSNNPVTWADYPGLGMGTRALVVTTNQFDSNNDFQYSAVWGFDKLVANNNSTSCPSLSNWRWRASPSVGDRSAFTLQPVQQYTNVSSTTQAPNPAYMVSSYSGSSLTYRVWRITNIGTGTPTLSVVALSGSYAYSIPPKSPGGRHPTSGNPTLIDTGDTRVLQAASLSNRIYLSHTTGCQFTSGTALEACARYVRIDAGISSTGAMTATIVQQSILGGGNGWYYSFPGVAVNSGGAVATAFNVGSTAGYPGSAYATKAYANSAFSGSSWLTQGTCYPNATFSSLRGYNRAGDYTGAQTSTDFSTFWLSAERAVALAGVGCGWQTRIARIQHG